MTDDRQPRRAYHVLFFGSTAGALVWQYFPIGPTWALYSAGLMWAMVCFLPVFGRKMQSLADWCEVKEQECREKLQLLREERQYQSRR